MKNEDGNDESPQTMRDDIFLMGIVTPIFICGRALTVEAYCPIPLSPYPPIA
jgi:hypothetical protein